MEGLIPKDEPSSFKTVGSKAKTWCQSLKINKSQDFAILNGKLRTLQGHQS